MVESIFAIIFIALIGGAWAILSACGAIGLIILASVGVTLIVVGTILTVVTGYTIKVMAATASVYDDEITELRKQVNQTSRYGPQRGGSPVVIQIASGNRDSGQEEKRVN